MSNLTYYNCDKCNFKTSAYSRMRYESMSYIRDENNIPHAAEGKSRYYCFNCNEEVEFFSENPTFADLFISGVKPLSFLPIGLTLDDLIALQKKKTKSICPECGKADFIGINIFKCPKCQNDLTEEEGPTF